MIADAIAHDGGAGDATHQLQLKRAAIEAVVRLRNGERLPVVGAGMSSGERPIVSNKTEHFMRSVSLAVHPDTRKDFLKDGSASFDQDRSTCRGRVLLQSEVDYLLRGGGV